jgi:hypothetical protein
MRPPCIPLATLLGRLSFCQRKLTVLAQIGSGKFFNHLENYVIVWGKGAENKWIMREGQEKKF